MQIMIRNNFLLSLRSGLHVCFCIVIIFFLMFPSDTIAVDMEQEKDFQLIRAYIMPNDVASFWICRGKCTAKKIFFYFPFFFVWIYLPSSRFQVITCWTFVIWELNRIDVMWCREKNKNKERVMNGEQRFLACMPVHTKWRATVVALSFSLFFM